jgi:integrase
LASIQKKGDAWYCQFMYLGTRHTFTIGKVDEDEAGTVKGKVEYLLMRIKQHLLDVPPDCNIVTFVEHDGKPPADPTPAEVPAPLLTLAQLRDDYLKLHTEVLDPRTIADMKGHWKHLARLLKEPTEAETLSLAVLQEYVIARVQEGVEAATAKKEIVTLRTCFNWGTRMELLQGAFPNRGLRFPKGREKPPFMTFAEVEKRIAAGEPEDLWESVFLTRQETDQLLQAVEQRAQHPWIYPVFCFAAHTGARRGELLRVLVNDVDLDAGTVLIREKKRRRDVHESTRRVPLSPKLKEVLTEWIAVHPGGSHLFCHAALVERSKKRSRSTGHQGEKTRATTSRGRMATVRPRTQTAEGSLTRNEISDHFHRTLAGTKWEMLKGFHVLRHSFVSNCAAIGVDQRLLDSWVGHTTEEMRRRYRHLIPSVEQQAISATRLPGTKARKSRRPSILGSSTTSRGRRFCFEADLAARPSRGYPLV